MFKGFLQVLVVIPPQKRTQTQTHVHLVKP